MLRKVFNEKFGCQNGAMNPKIDEYLNNTKNSRIASRISFTNVEIIVEFESGF